MTRYRYTVTLDARGAFHSSVTDQAQLREWALENAQAAIQDGDYIVIDVQVQEDEGNG